MVGGRATLEILNPSGPENVPDSDGTYSRVFIGLYAIPSESTGSVPLLHFLRLVDAIRSHIAVEKLLLLWPSSVDLSVHGPVWYIGT